MRGRAQGRDKGGKWKFEDTRPLVAAERLKKQYWAKEKVDDKGKKAGERKVKKEKSVEPRSRFDIQCGPKPTRVYVKRLLTKGRMYRVRNEEACLEEQSKGGTSSSCISRASKAQTRGLMHNETTW